MNFSGIYHLQNFWKKENMYQLDISHLTGTNCYCDDEAREELKKRIKDIPCAGIHFMDSGNYHYMSRIWMEKVKEPFCLLVFDNHTDLQPPAFGGILSCGGWIAAALEELPFLKEVVLVGPDEAAYEAVDENLKKQIRFFSREQLECSSSEEFFSWFSAITEDLPFYISVDKDILSEDELKTNWSQGEMNTETLLRLLKVFRKTSEGKKRRILGMDVCGECEAAHPETVEESNKINEKLLHFWIDTINAEGRTENV